MPGCARRLLRMPSAEHEGLVTLIERNPALAAELLSLSGGPGAPEVGGVRVESCILAQLDPARFHAYAVVVLRGAGGQALLALVVEVQRRRVGGKRFTWMVYVASVGARFR